MFNQARPLAADPAGSPEVATCKCVYDPPVSRATAGVGTVVAFEDDAPA
jgi:hypothetical protein